MNTVTRFAPSPTGYLHVGNLRTALLNWLLARKAGGRFVLRLDDTDPARSRPEYADAIRADLAWLGLGWDAEARQSERTAAYGAALERLRAGGRAYPCYETAEELAAKRAAQRAAGRPPVYDRAALALTETERAGLAAARPAHWRFRLAPGRVTWTDGILGPVSIDADSLSDPVLVRGDGQVLYTLASVADDAEMGITDIVRGADHVTNTAVQIQMLEALDAPLPRFAHHALLVAADGSGLSKRTGALALRDLRAEGVEPMALNALLARLGTGETATPAASIEALALDFELAAFGAAPTRFDPADLRALSTRVLQETDPAEALRGLDLPRDQIAPFWEAVRGNVTSRDDLARWWRICRDGPDDENAADDAGFTDQALAMLPPRPWDERTWGEWTADVGARTGRKGRSLFRPLRLALTGRDQGPEMARLMPLLRHPK